jgi:hypothetical protein
MLNNKKSFLQKARIAMVAIVTIMSLGSAYAMNSPKTQSATTWGVVMTNANSYKVTAVTADSGCSGTTHICEVVSTATPVNGILQNSQVSETIPGVFSK